MAEWKKKDGYHLGHTEGEPGVAVLKAGNRWHIYTNVITKPTGKAAGRYLTWRPTLREAKARALWAYLADLEGEDEAYVESGAA
jgi:hypothetical protein